MEIDRQVFDALDAQDRRSFSDGFADARKRGWKVESLEGGRVTNLSRDTIAIENLAQQGWKVEVRKPPPGRIIVASSKLGDLFGSGGDDQMDATLSLTLDESNSNSARYTYQARLTIKAPKSQSSTPSSGSAWSDSLEEGIRTNPQVQKLSRALKESGPPRFAFAVTLPGPIEQATLNGSSSGEVKGNQVRWIIPFDRVGVYDLQAIATIRPGQSAIVPPAVPTATNVPTVVVVNPNPPRTSSGLQGDCDGDGKTTESDALCALEMSVRSRPMQMNMDMDSSGDVTSRDVVVILQRALGK